jgi:hypothetical protein
MKGTPYGVTTNGALHYCRDVDEVHLSALGFVGGVDDDGAAVGTAARVRVAAPFAFVLRGWEEISERHGPAGRDVVEVHVLLSALLRQSSHEM